MGHILFQLLTGSEIFENYTDEEEMVLNIINKPIDFSNYDLTKEEQSLLKSMMCLNKQNRISAAKIMSNPLFKSNCIKPF